MNGACVHPEPLRGRAGRGEPRPCQAGVAAFPLADRPCGRSPRGRGRASARRAPVPPRRRTRAATALRPRRRRWESRRAQALEGVVEREDPDADAEPDLDEVTRRSCRKRRAGTERCVRVRVPWRRAARLRGRKRRTECVGWRLRRTPGRRRKRSVSAPMREGWTGRRRRDRWRDIRACPADKREGRHRDRPCGPTASSKASITVSEPPSISPNALIEMWSEDAIAFAQTDVPQAPDDSSRETETGASADDPIAEPAHALLGVPKPGEPPRREQGQQPSASSRLRVMAVRAR